MGAAASTNANAFLASAAPEDGALAAIQAMGAMEDELLATHYPVETVEGAAFADWVPPAQAYMRRLAGSVASQLDGWSSQSERFFAHLAPFFRFREEVEKKWAALSSGKVEAVPAVSPAAPPTQAGVAVLGDLYDRARAREAQFGELLRRCGKVALLEESAVLLPPLKSELRAAEKMNDDYARRPPPRCQYLCDILRGTLVCDGEGEIVACLTYLAAHATVLRLKNRFATPHFSGMRDCLLNLVVDGFVCEVQIRQRAIHAFAKEAQSHEHYEFFRSYFNGCEADSLTRCFSLLSNIHEGQGDGGGGGLLANVEAELASAGPGDAFRLENLADFLESIVCEGRLAFKVWHKVLELLSAALVGGGLDAEGARSAVARMGRGMLHISRLCKKGGLDEPAVATALLSLRFAGSVLALDDGLMCSARCSLAASLASLGNVAAAVTLLDGAMALAKLRTVSKLVEAQVCLCFAGVATTHRDSASFRGDREANRTRGLEAARRALHLLEDGAGSAHDKDANVAEGASTLAKILETEAAEEAEALHRRALATRERALGTAHHAVSVDLNNLANFLAGRDDCLGEAVALARRARDIDVANLGKDDTVLAKTWSFLGGLLVRGGHLEEAEEAYDAAVAVNEAAVRLARAGAPLDLARDLTNRAVLLAKRPAAGQDAEALLRRALQLLTYKTDAPAPLARVSDPVLAAQARAARSPAVRRATADALAALGGALMRRGAHADAEAYLRDAVARTADAPTGAHYGNLACCLLELEKPDAVDYAQKQLELDVVAYGENHALVAADEDALATALDLFDRVDEANAHGKKALDLATALLGADHATTRAYAESWGAEEGG